MLMFARLEGTGKSHEQHRVNYGDGHPGGNFSAWISGQVVSKESSEQESGIRDQS
jgi:hypothetical protein